MQQSMMGPGMEGLDPAMQGEPAMAPPGGDMAALEAAGSPLTPKSEPGGGRSGAY